MSLFLRRVASSHNELAVNASSYFSVFDCVGAGLRSRAMPHVKDLLAAAVRRRR